MVSGGFTIVADRVAQELEIDCLVANTLVIEDGVLTGEVVGPIVRQIQKKTRWRRLLRGREYDPKTAS